MERINLVYVEYKKGNLVNSNCLSQITAKSEFHTQIINAWSDINSFIPITIKEIINQSISENKYVKNRIQSDKRRLLRNK